MAQSERGSKPDSVIVPSPLPPEPPALKAGRSVLDRIPVCDTDDPADLESWFGPFGFFDHYRKVVLSSCKEIERVKAGSAVSEAKLDTLAHINDRYVEFLLDCHRGRRLREQNVVESRRGL